MTEEKPLYPTKEEAYLAPGEIYQHFKGGETGVGPRRKAGGAWRRDGVAQFASTRICVTISARAARREAYGIRGNWRRLRIPLVT